MGFSAAANEASCSGHCRLFSLCQNKHINNDSERSHKMAIFNHINNAISCANNKTIAVGFNVKVKSSDYMLAIEECAAALAINTQAIERRTLNLARIVSGYICVSYRRLNAETMNISMTMDKALFKKKNAALYEECEHFFKEPTALIMVKAMSNCA